MVCFLYVYFVSVLFLPYSLLKWKEGVKIRSPLVQSKAMAVFLIGVNCIYEHLKSLTELQVIQIDKNPPIRLDHIDQACVQCKKTVRVENWQDNHCSFRAVRWKLNGCFKNVLQRLRI